MGGPHICTHYYMGKIRDVPGILTGPCLCGHIETLCWTLAGILSEQESQIWTISTIASEIRCLTDLVANKSIRIVSLGFFTIDPFDSTSLAHSKLSECRMTRWTPRVDLVCSL